MKKVSRQEIVNTLLTDGQIVLDNYDSSQRNILNNEFAVDGLDYEGFTHWVSGNLTQNFLLSIPFAKKLAMLLIYLNSNVNIN